MFILLFYQSPKESVIDKYSWRAQEILEIDCLLAAKKNY